MKETKLRALTGHGLRLREKLLRHGGTYVLMWVLIMLADILTGPHVLLGIIYVIPVALAAWYRGFRFALTIAIVLPLCHIPISVYLEFHQPLTYAIINALIRIAVLWVIAKLVTTTSRHTQELETEVNVLEGMLPICSHCKKIRDEGSQWQPIERYISNHSEASFSHSVCPECMVKHYGEFVSDFDDPENSGLDD